MSTRIEKPGIISVVGAGGKTSLILRYAEELLDRGQPVIITTTTHMYKPPQGYYREGQQREIEVALNQGRAVWVGEPAGDGQKMGRVSEAFLKRLFALGATVLIEADGAKHFPFKVPAAHEPVIPEETKLVIGVAGLDCLGKPLSQGCFRAELAAELLHTDTKHLMTEEDLVCLLLHPRGTKKAVPAGAAYVVVLNKCDLPGAKEAGERIRELLWKRGCKRVFLT